ncbi:MAG: hypothetical protein FVQ85_09275 [Planctomycetes bacterium]|nr:hypothetical protein [Planctomycetota bacterium]
MKLISFLKTSGGFVFLALVVILPGQLADADPIIHESATMGAAGQLSGWGIDSVWFMGSRFYIGQDVQVTAIGGHMVEWTAGDFFGVIVSLDSAGDLPDGYPFFTSEVVASTVFDPGMPSSDFRTPLAVTLTPGYYALIFGSGRFGSMGGVGALPYAGQTNRPGASFILWDGFNWWNSASDRARFVVEGIIVFCDASGSDFAEWQYIMGVQVGSINNIPTGNDHYADYTSLSTTLMPEIGYPVTVTRGNPWDDVFDKCGLWVDWNQDQDFYDAGEQITMSLGVDPCTFTGTITPPAGAVLGNTRMRVRITWNDTPLPCGPSNYGEVEDYTINVSNSPLFVTISGYVKTSGGTGIMGVLVSASTGETDTTDVDGYYEWTLSSPWSGTITPSKTDWTFEPADRAYVNLTTDISDANFTGAHNIYGGGTGTAADPYLIFTASQMNRIGIDYLDWDSHFKLMADIDLGSYTGDSFNIIGGNLGKFEGVFDGNGKRIYNFTFTSVFPDIYIKGIFKHLDGANAEIKDLGLVNPNLNGVTGTEVGVLVGRLSGGCSISGCYVEGGSVSGGLTVGGLVGLVQNGTISNCYATCDVSVNNDYAGGLVGETERYGTISNSYAKGTVSGDSDVGGFVGRNRGTLSDCYATGDVTGEYGVGGLTGLEFGTVIGCYSTGSVTGIQNVGGLIGKMGSSAIVTNCHSSGNVFGNDSVGGLVGVDFFSPIFYCYSIGKVTGTGTDIGGLIGYTEGIITACFWDVDRSGMDTSGGGTGLTTAEMQMQSTYTDAGWDFSTPVWKMNCEGMSYPKLNYWQPVLGDFDCPDGVDFFDYSFFAGSWNEGNCGVSNDCDGRDLDLLGSVDIKDLRIFVDNWLAGL